MTAVVDYSRVFIVNPSVTVEEDDVSFDYLARSNKFLELMDNAEKAIEKVNADQIYTSKQFMRIRDEFYVSHSLKTYHAGVVFQLRTNLSA